MLGVCLDVMSCDRGRLAVAKTKVPLNGPVTLRADLENGLLRFFHNGQPYPGTFDATILSD